MQASLLSLLVVLNRKAHPGTLARRKTCLSPASSRSTPGTFDLLFRKTVHFQGTAQQEMKDVDESFEGLKNQLAAF